MGTPDPLYCCVVHALIKMLQLSKEYRELDNAGPRIDPSAGRPMCRSQNEEGKRVELEESMGMYRRVNGGVGRSTPDFCRSRRSLPAAITEPHTRHASSGSVGNQEMSIETRILMWIMRMFRRTFGNVLVHIALDELGFRYEIEIASGQLVEIDKVIKGIAKLEIRRVMFFIIDLISLFGYKKFDVVIGMDWLSNHKAEIICHEKVVRIPLPDSKVLRVLGEKPEEKMRQLKSAKAKEKGTKRDRSSERFSPEFFPGAVLGSKVLRINLHLRLGELSEHSKDNSKIKFLGHVINGNGIHVDHSKIKAVKNWKALRTLIKVRSFLGLAGYYRRFIDNFSKIAKSLTILTQKCKIFDWGKEQELTFQTLKDKLCNAPVLALSDGLEDFV
ncbi:putative reverse transcriptase domain-containing protein, partial [Tanacetum coccineum]